MSEFLDLNGLRRYDEKIKKLINDKNGNNDVESFIKNTRIGDIVESFNDLELASKGDFILANGRSLKADQYPDLVKNFGFPFGEVNITETHRATGFNIQSNDNKYTYIAESNTDKIAYAVSNYYQHNVMSWLVYDKTLNGITKATTNMSYLGEDTENSASNSSLDCMGIWWHKDTAYAICRSGKLNIIYKFKEDGSVENVFEEIDVTNGGKKYYVWNFIETDSTTYIAVSVGYYNSASSPGYIKQIDDTFEFIKIDGYDRNVDFYYNPVFIFNNKLTFFNDGKTYSMKFEDNNITELNDQPFINMGTQSLAIGNERINILRITPDSKKLYYSYDIPWLTTNATQVKVIGVENDTPKELASGIVLPYGDSTSPAYPTNPDHKITNVFMIGDSYFSFYIKYNASSSTNRGPYVYTSVLNSNPTHDTSSASVSYNAVPYVPYQYTRQTLSDNILLGYESSFNVQKIDQALSKHNIDIPTLSPVLKRKNAFGYTVSDVRYSFVRVK